jgi:hypothetical protein
MYSFYFFAADVALPGIYPIDLEGTYPMCLNNRCNFGAGEVPHLFWHAHKAALGKL